MFDIVRFDYLFEKEMAERMPALEKLEEKAWGPNLQNLKIEFRTAEGTAATRNATRLYARYLALKACFDRWPTSEIAYRLRRAGDEHKAACEAVMQIVKKHT